MRDLRDLKDLTIYDVTEREKAGERERDIERVCQREKGGEGDRDLAQYQGERERERELVCQRERGAGGMKETLLSTERAAVHRGTSLIRNCLLLGPYIRPMPRAIWWFWGGPGLTTERVRV